MTDKTGPERFADSELAPLIAEMYQRATPATRLRLLQSLLQPLGTLALVAVAAGAFSRFLPQRVHQEPAITGDMVRHIGAEQVEELARYVEQKSPEVLVGLLARPIGFGAPRRPGSHDTGLVNH